MNSRLSQLMIIISMTMIQLCATGETFPGVVWEGAGLNNYTKANRGTEDIRWIVIHTTEDVSPTATCQTSIQYFKSSNQVKDGKPGVSAHFVICQDGTIHQSVHLEDIAHHAGNFRYNKQSIGIEHERHGTQEISQEQYRASAALVNWLLSRYKIARAFPSGIAPMDPKSGSGIIGHVNVPDPDDETLPGGQSRKSDPVRWNWSTYIDLVGDGNSSSPDIAVGGNYINITNGDTSPSTDDRTDFGMVSTAGDERAYSISNVGTGTMDLSKVSVTGDAGFTIVVPPTQNSLGKDQSTLFVVGFHGTQPGEHTATVSITSNDPDEKTFTFAVRAKVSPEADITLSGGFNPIFNGSAVTSGKNGTDLGEFAFKGNSGERAFTLQNTGSKTLNLTGSPPVTFSGDSGFELVTPPETTLPPGYITTFVVRFNPIGVGTRITKVSIPNSAPNRDPFTFYISADVSAVPDVEVVGQGLAIPKNAPPSIETGTDFGNVNATAIVERKFFIHNRGTAPILLTGAVTVDPSDAGFTVIQQPASTIGINSSESFVVRYEPKANSPTQAVVVFASNDPVKEFYTFQVKATVVGEISLYSFRRGQWVLSAVDRLPVRSSPGFDQTYDGAQNRKFQDVGQITDGPIKVGSDLWWRVLWEKTTIEGWVPESEGGMAANRQLWAAEAPSLAKLEVLRGLNPIANGEDPSASKLTDFGFKALGGAVGQVGFALINHGRQSLRLFENGFLRTEGSPLFSVAQQLDSGLIEFEQRKSFVVSFDPRMPGVHEATISFRNNDLDANPFLLRLRATVQAFPRPSLLFSHFSAEGWPVLKIKGIPFQPVTLEYSSDLKGWQTVRDDLAGGDGMFEVTDFSADISRSRFYRAR